MGDRKDDRVLTICLGFAGGLVLGFGVGVFLDAEIVGGLESAAEDVFIGFCEDDVGGAHASPAAVDREENFGEILDEELLLLGIEHEVGVTLFDVGKGGEDVAADAEVGGAEVGALFGSGEAEGDTGEVVRSHGADIIADRVGERKSTK